MSGCLVGAELRRWDLLPDSLKERASFEVSAVTVFEPKVPVEIKRAPVVTGILSNDASLDAYIVVT